MSDTPFRPSPSKSSSTEEFSNHYKDIGQTLTSGEFVYFALGIPWLPSTSQMRELGLKTFGPLDEFLRVNLVNIPSKSLESYIADISELPLNPNGAQTLCLSQPKVLQRFSLPILLTISSFMFFIFAAFWTRTGPQVALSLATLAALLIGAISSVFCLEKSRRNSFAYFLRQELNRRNGLTNGGISKLPLYVAEPSAD